MIHAVELDSQTSSFVRQLEEQRRIEKNLMVERVRGSKEGLESVFHDIKERVDALERMTNSVSTSYIAPIGWSQLIFAGTDGLSAAPTIGFGDRDDSICKHDRIRYLEDANYLRLSANPHYVERVLPNKSAHARAAANPSTWDNLGYVHVGYSTALVLPASLEPTTVSILSRVNTLFNWVEVNAVADDWYAHVAATARLWVAYDGEFRQTPPAQFVNLLAMPKQVKTHQHIDSLAPSAALAMQLEVSPGSGTTLLMYETIELVATTPNAHAYIDGVFAWEPVAVQLREG
ncbi:MAG TPA: hypothetical protein VFR82_09995 [Nitrospira sp.]|nr:hypothetical protein [Nitrospira sp.]